MKPDYKLLIRYLRENEKVNNKKLVIISEKTKTANQFEFSQGKNLITSDKNTVGKSTLVKMILWAFGCKPKLDSSWIAIRAKTAIIFTIDRSEYCILRDGSEIKIRRGHDKYEVYPTISGQYSECVANMLSFNPIFKLKNSDDHAIATPDGYFMAYYLDQECWTKAWKSLEGLMHFNNATPDLVKTHSGLLTSEFFECKIEELNTLERRKEIEIVNEQYHSALDIVHKECGAHDESTFTIDEDLFALQNVEITRTLEGLQIQQSELWSNLTKLYSRRNHLRKHISIEERNIKALSKDYTYATSLEHIIHCPVCNSTVVNDVVERSGLMADRESCERILVSHKKELERIEEEITKQQAIHEDVTQLLHFILLFLANQRFVFLICFTVFYKF